MNDFQSSQFVRAKDVEEAVSVLSTLREEATLLAGGTWVMRAPIRCEPLANTLVSLADIPELHQIAREADTLSIGCLATHVTLARAIKGDPALEGLWKAASWCANPVIRHVATVGGNVCSKNFFAPDLVPALVSLGASVEVANLSGKERIALADYIKTREKRTHAELVCRILVPKFDGLSTHARFTIRKAGDYPIANLSATVELNDDHAINSATIAVGAVEEITRRWPNLEAALIGKKLDDLTIKSLANDFAGDFIPRNGADAPGWYRLRVLPTLVDQAFGDLNLQSKRGQ